MNCDPNDPDTGQHDPLHINPATGLPMVDDTWLDVGGSPYGMDVYQPPWTPPVPQEVWAPPWDAF